MVYYRYYVVDLFICVKHRNYVNLLKNILGENGPFYLKALSHRGHIESSYLKTIVIIFVCLYMTVFHKVTWENPFVNTPNKES